MTIASAIAVLSLLIIWPVSYSLNLWRNIGGTKLAPSDSIPISPNFRLGFEKGGMWIYTYEAPYTGSIWRMGTTNDPPPVRQVWVIGDYGLAHEVFFGYDPGSRLACDLPGIYFRRFRGFGNNLPYTTLRISLWLPILFSAVLPLL